LPGVFKEFREFISRGNVVELAVAVVIGAAFTRVVNAVVAGFITPLIGMIGGSSFKDLTFTIHKSPFTYGLVIDAVIAFVVVAVVVFFLVVKPINIMNERRRRGVEPAPEELSDEAALLTEIRNLLAAQAGGGRGGPGGQGPYGPGPGPGPGAPPAPPQSYPPGPTGAPPSTRGW